MTNKEFIYCHKEHIDCICDLLILYNIFYITGPFNSYSDNSMKHSYVDKSILNSNQNCLHSCDVSVLSKYNQSFLYNNIQKADRQS